MTSKLYKHESAADVKLWSSSAEFLDVVKTLRDSDLGKQTQNSQTGSVFDLLVRRTRANVSHRPGIAGRHLRGTGMHFSSGWNVDQTRILTRRELAAVLAAPAKTRNAQRNRVIVRLACCCGLRVSEIGKLAVGDVVAEGARPHLRLQQGNTKGKKGRRVPLWWDAGTLSDLRAWKAVRAAQGANEGEAFVCSVQRNRVGSGLQRAAIRRRFLSACKVLGKERLATLTIHHGRHTFISHALAGGRSLAEVRDAAGHANVAITSGYLHVAVDDENEIGHLFGS